MTQPVRKLDGISHGHRAALKKSHSLVDLQQHIRKLIELPTAAVSGSSAHQHSKSKTETSDSAIKVFYAETQSRFNFAFWWKTFRDALGDFKFHRPAFRVTPCQTAVLASWPDDRSTPVVAMIDQLRPFYAWPDKLADRYADGYRSAFVMTFLAAAFAVAMALGPLAMSLPEHSSGEIAFTIGELLAILFILFLVFRGRLRRSHQRWLDYRLLAEIIRHQRLIAHLGGERAAPLVPEHWAGYGDVRASWMAWYACALERSIGFPMAIVDRVHLQSSLHDLHEQLGGPHGQINFHRTTAARCSRIEHRLHLLEVILLSLTLACGCQHLAQSFWPGGFHVPGHVLTFCCGFFPAAGAALAGISNQGEFRRIAQRSATMAERLSEQLKKVQSLQQQLENPGAGRKQLSSEITAVASETARTMVNEVLDWRIIFQDRPLKTT